MMRRGVNANRSVLLLHDRAIGLEGRGHNIGGRALHPQQSNVFTSENVCLPKLQGIRPLLIEEIKNDPKK